MSHNFPTIISFYTDTWEYKKHSERLAMECEKLGLDFVIKEYPSAGSWIDNTRIKPSFIYETIKELQRPVLWLDVDASIYKLPLELRLPVEYDFMGVHQRTGPCRNWHVGTMFFNYSDRIVNLLEKWIEVSKSGTDEANFENVWKKYAKEYQITTKELPLNYYCIPQANYNNLSNPVITHRLSACESKRKLKSGGLIL